MVTPVAYGSLRSHPSQKVPTVGRGVLSSTNGWGNFGLPQWVIFRLPFTVTLDPNYANGYFFLGTALRYAGRPEEAIEMYNKAIRLDPI